MEHVWGSDTLQGNDAIGSVGGRRPMLRLIAYMHAVAQPPPYSQGHLGAGTFAAFRMLGLYGANGYDDFDGSSWALSGTPLQEGEMAGVERAGCPLR